jgi:hypothetical protein
VSLAELTGFILIAVVIAVALYGLRRGRRVKPDDYRPMEWFGTRPTDRDER